MTEYVPLEVGLDQILLDPNNFRFQGNLQQRAVAERRFPEAGVQAAAMTKLRADGLNDLKNSILSNGFVPVERIVVRKHEASTEESPLFVVLEGNRRVATLKWIKDDHAAGIEVDERVLTILESVPVLQLASGDSSDYLSIMGIRHVGGIKEWGGYQSAKLVDELRTTHGMSAQDVASRLALSTVEVNRRYRAFRAMEQMRTSEEHGEAVHSDLYPLFHEALVSPRVKTWLGWNEETSEFEDADLRESFYSLLAPYTDEKGTSRSPKITSYLEIRELKNLLDHEDARQSLLDLEKSFSDASALAKSDEASKNWISKIGSAIAALDRIGVREIKQLDAAQRAKLKEIADLANELYESSEPSAGVAQD
jgi:hypothetical protein